LIYGAGPIPKEIGNLLSLQLLRLRGNRLEGDKVRWELEAERMVETKKSVEQLIDVLLLLVTNATSM
jgi:hypothetical protein